MAAPVENLGTLERRLSMTVAVEQINRQVDERLKQLARSVKMPGFRPGRVPMKLLAQQYGTQVRSEVLGDAVQKAFSEAVKEANLKVAGIPRIEKKDGRDDAQALEFSAVFEVYPEISIGDFAAATVERPVVHVDDAAVSKTIGILRKQRTTWSVVARPARDGDRATVDFDGRIGGEPFEGGRGAGVSFVIGENKMLPAFDANVRGAGAGEVRTFELQFPADYPRAEIAGKTAALTLSVKQVEEPALPELDAGFARQLGVADGDVDKMRAEVKANVEREVKKRIEARIKGQALQALLDAAPLEVPKSLVQMETQRLVGAAAADLRARGLKLEQVPLDPQAFEAAAKRRVALGLLFAELARKENLQPKPAEVRSLIEAEAQSYESPAEVVKWFYLQPQRLSEMESLALEANVVHWILGKAKVAEKAVSFDELMGSG